MMHCYDKSKTYYDSELKKATATKVGTMFQNLMQEAHLFVKSKDFDRKAQEDIAFHMSGHRTHWRDIFL